MLQANEDLLFDSAGGVCSGWGPNIADITHLPADRRCCHRREAFLIGRSASKLRFSRFGAMLNLWFLSVVTHWLAGDVYITKKETTDTAPSWFACNHLPAMDGQLANPNLSVLQSFVRAHNSYGSAQTDPEYGLTKPCRFSLRSMATSRSRSD